MNMDHEGQFERVRAAVDARVAHLVQRAMDIAGWEQEVRWVADGHSDLDAAAMTADAEALRRSAPSMPDWPVLPARYGEPFVVPEPERIPPHGYEDEAEMLGLGGAEACAQSLRAEESRWPATLAWAVAERLLSDGEAAELAVALKADQTAASSRMYALEDLAEEAGRLDLVYGATWLRLLDFGVVQGLVSAVEVEGIWRALGSRRMHHAGG